MATEGVEVGKALVVHTNIRHLAMLGRAARIRTRPKLSYLADRD